jgi:uncharacterized protein (DUF362 family)
LFKLYRAIDLVRISMPKVAIVKGTKPLEVTVEALEMINANDVLPAEQPVLIKPNYINAKHPSTGITTDSRVIEGVVKFLKHHKVKNIVIGEGSGFADTFKAFKVAGVDAVADRWGVRLIDLNEDEVIEVSPPNPLALRKVKIAKTALQSTLISVPKLKLHRMAQVTLSIKNMIGAIAPKGTIHGHLSEKIADLASILKPTVAVIDGIIAGEGHETSENPVEMNLVLAGIDPIAVDAVGATVMGLPPETVKHLYLAEQKGLGTCNLKKITVVGEPINKVRKKFKRSLLSRVFTNLR